MVVFEVISVSSSRTDWLVKVREYAAVPSILRYILIESTRVGLMVLERQAAEEAWRTSTLTGEADTARIPAVNIEIPTLERYEDVSVPEGDADSQLPSGPPGSPANG